MANLGIPLFLNEQNRDCYGIPYNIRILALRLIISTLSTTLSSKGFRQDDSGLKDFRRIQVWAECSPRSDSHNTPFLATTSVPTWNTVQSMALDMVTYSVCILCVIHGFQVFVRPCSDTQDETVYP